MPTFTRKSTITCPADEVFAWHTRPGAFQRLSPPWRDVEVARSSGSIAPGSEVELLLRVFGPVRLRWLLRHGELLKNELFTDEQVKGPFKSWQHRHSFIPHSDSLSTMLDEVDYELPLFARPFGSLFTNELQRLFDYRHAVLTSDLRIHARYREMPRKRILIAGSSGFVGSALVPFLSAADHEVFRLVRREPRSPDERFWNPDGVDLSPEVFKGIDVVIHLGGEGIANGSWTEARKAQLRTSRINSTTLLALTIASLVEKPQTVIVASGAGFYGDTGVTAPDETIPAGSGFLAELAAEWEQAAQPVADAGVRLVNLRIGAVLNSRGGALKKMLPAFRLGLGGTLGSGKQRMGWIALQDLLGLIEHAIFTESLSGPLNAVAPEVITNREFTKALGRRLRRPTIFPVPAPLLRLIFGELADAALLANSAASARKAIASGYSFLFPEIDEALGFEVA